MPVPFVMRGANDRTARCSTFSACRHAKRGAAQIDFLSKQVGFIQVKETIVALETIVHSGRTRIRCSRGEHFHATKARAPPPTPTPPA